MAKKVSSTKRLFYRLQGGKDLQKSLFRLQMKGTHYLICYDIADEKRLRKVARGMEDFGVRMLYSVFECYLTPVQLEALRRAVEPLLDPLEDSVRYYVLCEHCEKHIEHLGREKKFLRRKEYDIL